MKITTAQLKQIIAEEIKRAVMNEADETDLPVSPAVQTMLDVVCDDWKSQFDPMDPSMRASGGKQVWEAQCDAACEVLAQKIKERKIDELIMQVEEDLHTGQFYSESNPEPVLKLGNIYRNKAGHQISIEFLNGKLVGWELLARGKSKSLDGTSEELQAALTAGGFRFNRNENVYWSMIPTPSPPVEEYLLILYPDEPNTKGNSRFTFVQSSVGGW